MADNQSREFIRHNEGEPSEVYVGPKRNPLTIEVGVDVDVSEALTGLKALQREAKEATKALRELESASVPEHVKKYRDDFGKPSGWDSKGNSQAWFSQVTTKQLVDELAKRNGVETTDIETRGINSSTITIDWRETFK